MHNYWLKKAIKVAEKGIYTTTPNPRVGCILVKDGRLIGQGWHIRAGENHAEINALNNAHENNESPAGSTAYISLEPCSHTGKTLPCVDSLIKAQIKEVVIADIDPNPAVKGNGVEKLKDASINVIHSNECSAVHINPGYFKRHRIGKPWVRLKLATSMDGRIACLNGNSKWITCTESRQNGHLLRLRSDAVITGVNTIIKDDPQLNVRLERKQLESIGFKSIPSHLQPLRIVMDSNGRTPKSARILNDNQPTLIATTQKQNMDVEQFIGGNNDQKVDIQKLLEHIATKCCNEVLVEAGATLSGSFIEQNQVDEIILYIAPSFIGHLAMPLLKLPIIENIERRWQFSITDSQILGSDLKITLANQAI